MSDIVRRPNRLIIATCSLLVVGSIDGTGLVGCAPADTIDNVPSEAVQYALPRQERSLRDAPPGIQSMLTDIVLENMPHRYEDTKHWGKTKEVVRGIKLRREGLRIETKRRRKHVNHGTWRMFRISLIQPEENLRVQIRNVHETSRGTVGLQTVVTAKVQAFGRVSQWQRGVQLISLSADAVAEIELRTDCELDVMLDPSVLPPDVILKPKVIDADLVAHSFRVQRISKAKGPLARELGSSLHDVLMRKVDDKKHKIVAKINRQIAKHKDDLRFSLHDAFVQKWLPSVKQTPGNEVSGAAPKPDGNGPPSSSLGPSAPEAG